jgi:hypothetical protein
MSSIVPKNSAIYDDIDIEFGGQQYKKPKSIVSALEFKYLPFSFPEIQSFSLLQAGFRPPFRLWSNRLRRYNLSLIFGVRAITQEQE